MSLYPRRRISGRSPPIAWREVSPASTWGHGRGSAKATNVYYRGKYGKDGWVKTSGVAPFSWRFLLVWSLRWWAPEFRSCQCGRKSTLFGRWCQHLRPRPCAFFPVTDVSLEVRCVVWDHGWFFGQLNIVGVSVIPSKNYLQMTSLSGVDGRTRRHDLTIFWSCLIQISFAAPTGHQCGGVGGGGLGERLFRVGSDGASR